MKRWTGNSRNMASGAGAIFWQLGDFWLFVMERLAGSKWTQKTLNRALQELSIGSFNFCYWRVSGLIIRFWKTSEEFQWATNEWKSISYANKLWGPPRKGSVWCKTQPTKQILKKKMRKRRNVWVGRVRRESVDERQSNLMRTGTDGWTAAQRRMIVLRRIMHSADGPAPSLNRTVNWARCCQMRRLLVIRRLLLLLLLWMVVAVVAKMAQSVGLAHLGRFRTRQRWSPVCTNQSIFTN